MNPNSMLVLRYVHSNGKTDIESIFSHFKFDISKQPLSTAIDELIHKNLIEREFEGSPFFVVTGEGLNAINNQRLKEQMELKRQAYFERERISPRMQYINPNNNQNKVTKSPIVERISWIVTILGFLISVYELILTRIIPHLPSLIKWLRRK